MIKYAHIKNGTVVNITVWDDYLENTDFTDEDLIPIEHSGVGIGYSYKDGNFVDERKKEFPTVKEIESRARSERNSLLSASDWTQVPDAPVDQAAWAEYRQALRDLPLQTGFPTDIDWPTKPE